MQLRELIKKTLPRSFINFFRKIAYPEKIYLIDNDLKSLFKTHYQQIAAPDLSPKIAFLNHEFKVYSKYGNDGLLLYIFSRVGVTSRTFVEIGVEDGKECNTANLSLNFGWQGLLIDSSRKFVEEAKRFYQKMLRRNSSRVKISQCFVTAENINKTLLDNDIKGEIDLLSIDIDGNDYWVWKAIDAIKPRVVVIEYNASLGTDKSMTIKYDPNFTISKLSLPYYGASLLALAKLANSKGYILVGCESNGIDAFFVRKDIAQGKLIEVSVKEAYYPHSRRLKIIGSTSKQFEQIKHFDFKYV